MDTVHIVESCSRYGIAVLLLLGSFAKWANFSQFIESVRSYNIVPVAVVGWVAFAVASAELFTGASLLRVSWLPWSAYGALSLFLIFTIAISVNLLKGRFDLDCGCGFWGKAKVGWHLILRNLGLVGLAVIASRSHSGGLPSLYFFAFLASLAMLIVPVLPAMICQH